MEERGRPGDQAGLRVLPPENPRLPQPKRPTGRKVKRSHTRAAKSAPGEIDHLIAVSPPWLRCLLTIAALTGMRRGDCLALSPAHCDDDLTVISLTQAKTKIAVSLPIAPGLQAVLRDAPGPATSANVPYVDRYAGKPVTGSMVDNAMIDALEAIERRPAVDKSSTVTMSGKEILKQRKLTIGMDLGDRSSRYCVLDEAGDVILERSVARDVSNRAFTGGYAALKRALRPEGTRDGNR